MFNRITFEDKLRVGAKLEIEDERTSKIGSYAKFLSHLKLIFGSVWLAIRFLNNVPL